jgi:membrane peptidoglycan carboxypeptidase
VLAGLVQRPGDGDPLRYPEAAQQRRNQVLNRMYELGHISDQELADISASPVQTVESGKPPNGCAYATIGGFFCDYLHSYLNNTLGLSDSELQNGGYTIQTTLRPDMQQAGDQAVLNTLPMGDDLAAMYTAVEPGTGHVLAMSVNRRYGCHETDCESVNLNTVASQGGGSTYKVFTAAAALEQGYSQHYTLTTGDRYTSKVYRNAGKPYSIGNAGPGYPATTTMVNALYMSSNTYFVALEDALGSVEPPVRMAQRMGLHSIDPIADQIIAENRGSFTLGPEATSPLDLASAYSTLAANGTQCNPTPVTQVLDQAGQPLLGADGQPVVKGADCTANAIPVGVATTLTQILRKDVEPGNPGQTARRAYVPGHQIAGKTGTSQENFSVSFVGYTPRYTASVMVLNPKTNQDVGGFGGDKSATIWHDAMAPVLAGEADIPFPPADPTVADGNTRVVPDCSSVGECRSALTDAGLPYTTSNASTPATTTIRLDPPAGSRVAAGTRVTIIVDDGASASETSSTPSAGPPARAQAGPASTAEPPDTSQPDPPQDAAGG